MAKKLPVRKDGSPSKRGAHFRDPEFQRRMRARVSSESCAANGRKGWLALVARHGIEFAAGILAAWRRSRLTDLEAIALPWLDEFQISYEREKLIGDVYADVAIEDIKLVIEIDSRRFHSNDALHGEDRVGRDRYKDKVYRKYGYAVLRLPEAAIRDGSARDVLDRAIHARMFGRM